MSDQASPEDFRSQVQRLVAEGKLSAEDAAGLLEGHEETPEQGRESPTVAQYVQAVEGSDQSGSQGGEMVSPNLLLRVAGYTLSVVQDATLTEPHLSASQEDELELSATSDGWIVERVRRTEAQLGQNLRAILTLPFAPQHVRTEVHGGLLTLPDITGELHAGVNGGSVRMGNAASLQAEVNGGNLNAGQIAGASHLSVNGGNLSLSGAGGLNASVNGGNLKWAGTLGRDQHRLEVNAGNATLHLLPGSSLRLHADVTVGSLKADFPLQKRGGFINTHYSGQLGGGEAELSCKVAAGQVRLVSA